ncbi:hypothetical protein JT358_08755 [Micrococcales bacterium 31B]|nr:hypothetical protein [Micrococcales bacterium 31B]
MTPAKEYKSGLAPKGESATATPSEASGGGSGKVDDSPPPPMPLRRAVAGIQVPAAWGGVGRNPCEGTPGGIPVTRTELRSGAGPNQVVDAPTPVGDYCINPTAPAAPGTGQPALPVVVTVTFTQSDFARLSLNHRETYCSCVPTEDSKPSAVVNRPQAY